MYGYLPDVRKRIIALFSFEGRGGVLMSSMPLISNTSRARWIHTHNHFINKNTQRPPVHSGRVPLSGNNFGRNIF